MTRERQIIILIIIVINFNHSILKVTHYSLVYCGHSGSIVVFKLLFELVYLFLEVGDGLLVEFGVNLRKTTADSSTSGC